MNAIFFILRTGAQWNSLDAKGICSCSSAYRRFREWSDAGVFEEFWKQGVKRSLPTVHRQPLGCLKGYVWIIGALSVYRNRL